MKALGTAHFLGSALIRCWPSLECDRCEWGRGVRRLMRNWPATAVMQSMHRQSSVVSAPGWVLGCLVWATAACVGTTPSRPPLSQAQKDVCSGAGDGSISAARARAGLLPLEFFATSPAAASSSADSVPVGLPQHESAPVSAQAGHSLLAINPQLRGYKVLAPTSVCGPARCS